MNESHCLTYIYISTHTHIHTHRYNKGQVEDTSALDVRIVMNYKISSRAGYQKSRSEKDFGNEAKFFAQAFPPFDESRTINYYFGHIINRRISTDNSRSKGEYISQSLQTSQSGQDDEIVVNVQLDLVPKIHRVRSGWKSFVPFAKNIKEHIVRKNEIVRVCSECVLTTLYHNTLCTSLETIYDFLQHRYMTIKREARK